MKSIVSFALLLIIIDARAQTTIQSFVKNNTAVISSIDIDTMNFNELEPIGKAIGDARIVMLGEQDHGDAPAFTAKTKLVEYLHKTKGFDVIAFESDFFSATVAFEKLTDLPTSFQQYYKGNILPYWTLCDACSNLFTKVIPESFSTASPLILTGFDSQAWLKYSNQQLVKTIDSIVKANKLEVLQQQDEYDHLLAAIGTLSNPVTVAAQNKKFYEESAALLIILKEQLEKKTGTQTYGSLLIDNLITTCYQIKFVHTDFAKSNNYRDQQMAKNLQWLCNIKYPDKKIIVWAANYHVSKYTGHFSKQSLNENISMGTEFVKNNDAGNTTYVIGFASYDGTAGRIGTKTFEVDKPEKDGFENWIDPSVNYAFINFKAFNASYPLYEEAFALKSSVSAQGVHKSNYAAWNRMFDGIFFIRHMYPCKIAY